MRKTILKVRLLDRGIKGVFIEHVQTGVRKNLKFRETHKITYDAPANEELTALFDDLQVNFRHLAVVDDSAVQEDVHVIEARISPDGNYLQLVGTVRSVGETQLKMITPRVGEGDGYTFFGECLAKIKALFAEAKSYITEKKVMNMDQMVLQFSVNDKKFDEKHPEGVGAMSEEEKDNYARERLEKKGSIIIDNEFADPGDREDDDEEQGEGADAPIIESEPEVVVPEEETPKETEKTGKIRKLKQEAPAVVIPQQPIAAFGDVATN
jgi:hypothetical protein